MDAQFRRLVDRAGAGVCRYRRAGRARLASARSRAKSCIPLQPGCLESTESTATSDADADMRLFDEISAPGVRISVDGFGNGYSSLARLRRSAIHKLRIDHSFVQHMTSHDDDAAIVPSIIALAHGLGLCVIAEGMETAQRQRFLAGHACDAVQAA